MASKTPRPAGHVGEQPRHLGEEEDAEEVEEGDVPRARQQGVEHGGGEHPVERATATCSEGETPAREGQLQAPDK